MIKMKLKDIKTLTNNFIAVNVTGYNDKQYYQLKDYEKHFTKIAFSAGEAGVTGILVQGLNTGSLYAVTAKTSILFNLLA